MAEFDGRFAEAARQHWIEHDGVRLNLREWGPVEAPAVVLVHGGAAHSHWWDHVAPLLADARRVVALDLSGHGDSGWRTDGYTLDGWASEVGAVATLVGKPTVIGHSLGGLVALKIAMRGGVGLSGVIVLDVVARRIGADEQARRDRRAGRESPVFATRDEAIAAFRTLPDAGPNQITTILHHIAAHSLRQTPEGWTLKAERKIFLRDSLPLWTLAETPQRIELVSAEHGLLSPDRAAAMAEQLGAQAMVSELPGAGHHMMIDQPIALTKYLEATLRRWAED